MRVRKQIVRGSLAWPPDREPRLGAEIDLAAVRAGRDPLRVLWWVTEYPYRNRTVRAFFAGGNGGQVVMGIPELDLVIAFYGGNYSDPALFKPQRVFVPQYILPAIK